MLNTPRQVAREAKTIRVAAVEDHRDMLSHLRQVVSGASDMTWVGGYRKAEDALKTIADLKPDVLMVDLELPGMNGLELITLLNAQAVRPLMIILTNYDLEDHIFPAVEQGASGYLLKSEDHSKVLDCIRLIHGGMRIYNAGVSRRIQESLGNAILDKKAVERLSPRELEVLKLMARGCANKQIADQLDLSAETIRTYIKGIFDKLHTKSRGEAVAKAFRIQ